MSGLPRFALARKSLVLAALALALFWSIASFFNVQRREDPGTTQRQTEIVTLLPGATTENVEQLVTKKIEDAVRPVAHVDHVEGTSRPGISDITVVLDDEMQNADGPLRDVRNAVADARASLPPSAVGPTQLDSVWTTYPIVLGLSADGLSPRALRDFATALRDRIATLPDVGEAVVVGAQEENVDVDLDLRALSQYGISADEVAGSLAARNALVPSGTVSPGGRVAQVDPSDALRTPADVTATNVRTVDGRTVRVGDLARVTTGYPDPPQELVRVDGRPGVALAIKAKETSSVTTLGPEVRAFLDRERENWPAGVRLTAIADQPVSVSARVNDFFSNLLLAVVIVTLLVALFMGWRNGALVGATVVLSIVLTFGVMVFFHVDINQISILALIISLGIIVDAGIVSVDNIEHHLRAGDTRKDAAARGVGDLWFPLLTSMLVAMSSFLPFRLMGGAIGDFVRDLAVVTCISLGMSLLVAYFVTPILGEWFAVPSNAGGRPSPFDRVLGAMQRAYVPLATASLRRPLLTVGIAIAAVVGAFLWVPHLGVQFFPSADRNQFFIDVNAPAGTDIRATERIVAAVERDVLPRPGVTSVGSFVGAGAPRFYYNVLAEQPKPSYAQIIVDTTDIPSANRLVDELRRSTAGIPGARIDVKRLEQGPPVGAPIQLRFSGEDREALAAASAQAQTLLRTIPGATHVRDSLAEPTTRFAAHIDEDRAAAAGVDAQGVQRIVAMAYGGAVATEIRERDRQTPVVVRLPETLRADPSQFGALGVPSSNGATVPLAEVATVEPAFQTSVATYRDGLPTVTVLADANGRLASDVLADFRARAGDLHLAPGVRLAYAGEDEQTTKSFRNLAIAVVVGLLINQMILLWEFRTLRLSLVVLCAVPLGVVGAVAGLALTHQHFGFVASLGISSLGGIVTNHAIVLFEYAKREMESGAAMEEALIAAGSKRLRPILLTVIASIVALLPLAFSAQTLWQPFCWAVIFGLGGSMLMTLVAIPAIYRLAAGGTARRTSGASGSLGLGRGVVELGDVSA